MARLNLLILLAVCVLTRVRCATRLDELRLRRSVLACLDQFTRTESRSLAASRSSY
jgi:hypothetical protein